MEINVKDIFESALKDPSLFSTLDIESLLSSVENVKNDYLENKTLRIVTEDIFNTINTLPCELEDKQQFCEKLSGYRIVDRLDELHKGKHIRWIRISENPVLTNGGLVTNIQFLDKGVYVTTMNVMKRFVKIKLDDCIVFQKMTMEEQLILMAYEHMDK